MEEILASIRRIIADDQDRIMPARFGAAPARPLVRDAFGPLLDEAEDEPAEPAGEEPAPAPATSFLPPAFEEAAQPAPVAEAAPAGEPAEAAGAAQPDAPPFESPAPDAVSPEPDPAAPEALVSPQSDAAAGLAFQRLAATVRPRPALTMEEHVTEMLRPMLRAWLDENLPPLVERLVQAEIERISRSR